MQNANPLFAPLTLPCGVTLKNRIIKSAMSDSLGDGTGHPSPEQMQLYSHWAKGGLAAAIIGEVQGSPLFAEKPGNLVLNTASDLPRFRALAKSGSLNDAFLWLQLGHAGAMSYRPTSTPKGPSALDLPSLKCDALTLEEIKALPGTFAQTAALAQEAGFGGVQIHAAHGFLLSQFLSPLFNLREDNYGGNIQNRMRLLLEVMSAVRRATGPDFPISVKLNATDQLEGGFEQAEALEVVKALNDTSMDLLDISGGTYFPGAKSASDSSGTGPYFQDFAKKARLHTTVPLMLTGGIKTHQQATSLLRDGTVDVVGLARLLILNPSLPTLWAKGEITTPDFPRFSDPPEGGITAWFTMQMTEIANNSEVCASLDLNAANATYAVRDERRTKVWIKHFGPPVSA